MPKTGTVARKTERPLTAVGITCGIGSMLVGARQAGFKVLGNVEWRKYYHFKDKEGRNSFTENFPGAIFKYNDGLLTDEETERLTNATMILGHPECGAFSNLRNVKSKEYDNPCDIPLFVDLVAKFRPRFFAMDDLPLSFKAFPMSEYVARLPDYDLFPEWVSNYNYGNVQKHRKRMFMLGSLKSERWAFRPGEVENDRTVKDEIGDLEGLEGTVFNHDVHNDYGVSNCPRSPVGGPGSKYLSWEELADWFRDRPTGTIYSYVRPDGREVCKFGLARLHWEAHSHVLHGGRPLVHPNRCYPLTIRERARIQGFPDEFKFYGTKYDEEGFWDHEKNNVMIKQTGKAMPVQFCRYVASQVAAHVLDQPIESSGVRVLSPNEYVDAAKRWYCENVGYADQERACGECWMRRSCKIRTEKYGLSTIEEPTLERTPTTRKRLAVVPPSKVEPKAYPIRKVEGRTVKFGG